MSSILVVAVVLMGVGQHESQLPLEASKRYAAVCVEKLGPLGDAQFETIVDVEKPCAVQGEGGGAMVIPDKKLSAKALVKLGKDEVPVGQLWLRKWTVAHKGKGLGPDRLRMASIEIDEKARPMALFLLAVRKKGKNAELLLYSSEPDPVLVVELEAINPAHKLPVELEWKRGDKDIDPMTINIVEKYRGVIPITRQSK